MKANITILFAKKWEMVDEATKEKRAGISVQYIMSDSLDSVKNDDGSLGYMVTKESLNVELENKLLSVPGIYEAEFQFKGSGGKNVLHVVDINAIAK